MGNIARDRDQMIVCVLPREVEPGIAAVLRRTLPEAIPVVEERRRDVDRRRCAERRRRNAEPGGVDRRRIPAMAGRRIGERRAPLVPVAAPPISWRGRRAAASATFFARLERPADQLEDEAAARLVVRSQAGDDGASQELRAAWSERAYAFAWIELGASRAAREVAEAARAVAVRRAAQIDPLRTSFRCVLFGELLTELRGRPLDPRAHRLPSRAPTALPWLKDADLVDLVRALSRVEREAVLLRYVGGLSQADVMELLDLDRVTAREVTDAGLVRLRGRQGALLRA